MIKSQLGNYAHEYWQAIPEHFPFVRLGAFVVMPNHVHGIIIIDRDNIDGDVPGRDAKFCVSTGIWQPRYHDHIIRNADEYKRIETYIVNNPAHWEEDKFYDGQTHDD